MASNGLQERLLAKAARWRKLGCGDALVINGDPELLDEAAAALASHREALIDADSVCSYVAHRHSFGLPADIREWLLNAAAAARKCYEEIGSHATQAGR